MKNCGPALVFAVNAENTAQQLEQAARNANVCNPLQMLLDCDALYNYLQLNTPEKQSNISPRPLLMLLEGRFQKTPAWEIITQLRSQPVIKRLPILVLALPSDVENLKHFYDAGANSCVRKPETFEEWTHLLAQIKSYWVELNTQPEWGD
jgi:CheY-like chemotaxis protein